LFRRRTPGADGSTALSPLFRRDRFGSARVPREHAAIGSAWETITFLSIAPKNEAGRPILSRAFSDADLKLVADGVPKKCDALDGLTDGLVMNTRAPRFDPGPLQCVGAKQPNCLSGEQVAALEKVIGGPKNSRGQAIYSDWTWDAGIASPRLRGAR